jgi:hypothetical protein
MPIGNLGSDAVARSPDVLGQHEVLADAVVL